MADRVAQIINLISNLNESEKTALQDKLSLGKNDPTITTHPTPSAKNGRAKEKGIACPHCRSCATKLHGKYRNRSRYKCLSCSKTFNDMTNTPLSGSHHPDKMRALAAEMAGGGKPLRKSAEKFGIHVETAFEWRHKIMQGYNVAPSRKLKEVAEADETFFLFSEKGDKSVSKRREPRKRGGKARTAGISEDHVAIILACDRDQELILGVASRGRISVKDIEEVLGERIDVKATFCTDSHSSFKAFAKAYDLKYQPINVSKGQRVVKKVYHIQNANSAHMRLKTWMIRFHGVSTKHLASYARWFGLMEETKHLENREEQFTQRSVVHKRS